MIETKLMKISHASRTLIVILGLSSSSAFAVDELPGNLSNISLDSGLATTINEALPESSQVDADFLSPNYNPNINLTDPAQIAITFVDEGAGYRNTLGYFNFQTDSFDGLSFGDVDINNNGRISVGELDSVDGVSTGTIFPNFSEMGGGGSLNPGDTTVIGDGTAMMVDGSLEISGGSIFSAGTSTGFLVMANAWNGRGIRGLDQPGDPNVYYSLDFLNPENSASATLTSPDSDARHVAMMFATEASEEVIVGFEDLRRPWGDNDFNDAVFIVQTNPFSAIRNNTLPIATAPATPFSSTALGFVLLLLGYPAFRRKIAQ